MLRKSPKGKLVYRDQERGLIIAVFDNKNIKGTRFGKIIITALQGIYKDSITLSIPEFERMKMLIDRMPKIEIKKKK